VCVWDRQREALSALARAVQNIFGFFAENRSDINEMAQIDEVVALFTRAVAAL